MDVHSRLMSKYKEVPDWWFLIILFVTVVLSIIFVKIYPLDTPVWLVFLVIAINLVFAVPLSLLSATTGTNLGLGSLIQVITGFVLPNNPNAFLFAQTLGSWALAGYGDNYVQDQKMAHYVKIAPRAVFRSQIVTIIITCFVAVGTQDFIMSNVKGTSARAQRSAFRNCCQNTNRKNLRFMHGRPAKSLHLRRRWCTTLRKFTHVGCTGLRAHVQFHVSDVQMVLFHRSMYCARLPNGSTFGSQVLAGCAREAAH
jgi:OPT family oligopeptide transporter